MTLIRMRRRGFSLVELLVVIAMMAMLLGLLIPALSSARRSAAATSCLSQMRQLQIAAMAYVNDNDILPDAGLPHGTSDPEAEKNAWFNTLRPYYRDVNVLKCPSDRSPFWSKEMGGQGATLSGRNRTTSYGVNNWTTQYAPTTNSRPLYYRKIERYVRPGATVHFLEMVQDNRYSGDYATADHPHVETWSRGNGLNEHAKLARAQVQIGCHGGEDETGEARSNWGFLDGHAETRAFAQVYQSDNDNDFDPEIAD